MIKIKDLKITQYGLRNRGQLQGMIDFVRGGGCFNKQSLLIPGPLVQLAVFEDGEVYIADGHHRIAAMIMAGREEMFDEEYTTVNWKYSEYTDINLNCGWVTPFDPRVELRIADYAEYKADISKVSLFEAKEFIRTNKAMYVVPKKISTISELIVEFDLP